MKKLATEFLAELFKEWLFWLMVLVFLMGLGFDLFMYDVDIPSFTYWFLLPLGLFLAMLRMLYTRDQKISSLLENKNKNINFGELIVLTRLKDCYNVIPHKICKLDPEHFEEELGDQIRTNKLRDVQNELYRILRRFREKGWVEDIECEEHEDGKLLFFTRITPKGVKARQQAYDLEFG